MMGAPGSIGWLARHEARLFWYNAASGKSNKTARRPGAGALAAIALAWLVLHVAAFFIVSRSAGLDAADPRVLVAVTALLFGCMTFMLSSALSSSVLVLFERGDLDLLLSSPLSSRSIFAVRLGTVAIGTAALYLFLLAPFAHVGAMLGYARWLAVYPVILGCATIIACTAMLMTLGLVRVIGARRTRVVAQVIGALAGALLFILSQLFSHFSDGMEARAATAFARAFSADGPLGASSPLWLPGRALLGEPLPVLGLVLAAMAAALFTAARTHRFFVHGLQQAASSRRAAPQPAGGVRYRFGRSLFDTVVRKEWRLIARDPHLISQVALQLIYLLPLFFIVFRRSEIQLPAVAAGLTLLCASLTASLAWIVVSAEDAPDLLRLAPAAPRIIRLAKLAAAAMPALALVAIPLFWLVVRAPVAGLLACFTVSGAVCAAALVVHWCGKPGTRSDYASRGKGGVLRSLLEVLNGLSWGGMAWCLVSAASGEPTDLQLLGTVGAFGLALFTLALAWFLRRPQP
jgi:ABC-2 type transport system permease protein